MTGVVLGILILGNGFVVLVLIDVWRTGRDASKRARGVSKHLGAVLALVVLTIGGVLLFESLPKRAPPSAWLVGVHAAAVAGTVIAFVSIVLERAHAWWRQELYVPERKDLHRDFVRVLLLFLPLACLSGSLILVEIV